MRHFVPITKVDAVKREVWGTAAEEAPDKSGEVMDYAASKPLFEEWSAGIAKTTDGKSLGNVRSMHGDVAAGKVINLQFDDVEKKVMVGAKIVDDNEWKKVEEGVYTGFSVGGKYGWRKPDPKLGKMRYQAVPVEISLVDNPCMYGATFSVVKADGAQDLAKFVGGEATPEELAKLSNEEANAAYEAKWSIQDASGPSARSRPWSTASCRATTRRRLSSCSRPCARCSPSPTARCPSSRPSSIRPARRRVIRRPRPV
jgi:hypothetical protein